MLRTLMGLLFFAGFFFACSGFDQFDDLEIETFSPEFGFPLINSEISMEELLNIQTGNGLSVIEVVNDDLIIKYFQDASFNPFLILPSKAIHETLPVLPYSFDVFYEDYAILGSSSEIKKLHLKEGSVSVLFTKDFDEDDVYISLHLPGLTADEETVLIEADWGNGSDSSEHLIDLEGSILELFRIEDGDTLYNTLTYELELSSEGNASGNVEVYLLVDSPKYEKFFGNIEFSEEISEIDLQFDLLESVTADPFIYLGQAFLELGIGTSVGVPFSLLLDTLLFENADGEFYFLANKVDLPPEGDHWRHFNIGEKNYPDYALPEEPFTLTNFRINNENSTLDSLFAFLPTRLKLSGEYALGDFDPADPVSNPYNFFVLDTSSVYISTRLEIPFVDVVMDLALEYPITIESWPDLDEDDLIQDFEISLITKTRNNFPLSFSMQVDFLDDDGNIIDSVFDHETLQHIIESPDVDNNGDPIGFQETSFVISLNKEKFDRISASSKANMSFRVVSSGAIENTVNLRPSQLLGVQMALILKATIGDTPY